MENGSCYQTGLRRFPHILLFRWVWRWELLPAMEVFVAKVAVSPVSVQMHVQQGPWGAWPADWHRQPFFFFKFMCIILILQNVF